MRPPEVASRALSVRTALAPVAIAGAGVIALVAGQTDPIARWVAFGVLAIGLGLLLRAWRTDPEVNADGAGFASCILAAGVAVPFVLGIVGVLFAFLLVPLAAGVFARHWVRATRRSTAAAAFVCGIAIVPLTSWFGGRADERPSEGFIAGLLLFVVLGTLVWLRRSEMSADGPADGEKLNPQRSTADRG